MKQKIRINVVSDGRKQTVLKAAHRRIPTRLLHLLFGDFTDVYLMKPGECVDSVDIMPVKGGKEEAR